MTLQTLVICEKPSVAKTIAAVLGANKRGDGFFHGNGYIVSWCYGHLLELAKPEAYDEKYKKRKTNRNCRDCQKARLLIALP